MAARRLPGRLVRAAARAVDVPGAGAVVRRASGRLLGLGRLRAARLPDGLAPLVPDQPTGSLPHADASERPGTRAPGGAATPAAERERSRRR